LSLPLEMKTYGPVTKRVIRAGMEGLLPEVVRCRTSFAHPGQAFLSSLLDRQSELLQPASFRQTLGSLQRYVSLDAAEAARNSLANGSPEARSSVWQLLSLALWLENKNLSVT
jgi:hypothetical protein